MRSKFPWLNFRLQAPVCQLTRISKDEQGTTAIEFAMVAAPFFLLAFAIMGIGLQFFTINSLEHGVESAARQIRTGQMQAGYDNAGTQTAYTVDDFRALVCAESGAYIDCNNKLVIHVSSAAEWSGIALTPCMTGTNLTPATGSGTDAISTKTGGASQVVLVTACYEWDLGGAMWQDFWNLLTVGAWGSGTANTADKVVVQAVSTFRTEPYN